MSSAAIADEAYLQALHQLYALGQELAPLPPLPDGTPVPRRKWDLAHMRTLCAALGDPQNTFPSVLIAGTNGKGSTASTLASILAAAGYKTGLYTSPHLSRVNERIQILPGQRTTDNGQSGIPDTPGAPYLAASSPDVGSQDAVHGGTEIPDDTFARLFSRVDDTALTLISEARLPHHPSFFEVLTAQAFLYFAEETVDIAILEVGLGGRLDATNVVEPLLSVITDIALDHQEYLGNTIAEITREKAGILRANGTLITLPQHPEANQAIGEAAALLNLQAISAADFIPSQLPTTPSSSTTNSVILSEVSRSASPRETQSKDPLLPLPLLLPVPPTPPTNSVILSEVSRSASPRETQSKDPLLPLPLLLPVPPTPPTNSVILSEVSRSASPRETQSKDPLLPLPMPLPVPPNLPTNSVILSEVSRSASPRETQSKDPDTAHVTSTAQPFQPPTPTTPSRNHYTLTLDHEPLEIDSPLSGHHQQRNIALAIATAIELRNPHSYKSATSNQISYKIEIAAIGAGIRYTHWPGRLEFLPPNILLDVAHNPAGAWTLRAAIAHLPESQPRTLLFSCLGDKDLKEMSRILFSLFDSSPEGDRPQDHIVLAPIANPRAARVGDLLAAAHDLDIPAHAAPHLAGALTQARAITPPGGLIIATGSVYLVGAIRDLVLREL